MLYKYYLRGLPAANIITRFHSKQNQSASFVSLRTMKAFFTALQTNGDGQLLADGLTALTGLDAEGFSVMDSEASLVPVPRSC